MRMTILDYNLKENFDDNYFKLNESYQDKVEESKSDSQKENDNNQDKTKNQDEQKNSETNPQEQSQSKIDDIVYPMYLPLNTYLSSQDKVSTETGERVIMTFSGAKPFLLVQETATVNNTTDYVNGDPYLIQDTIGAVTDYSVSWIDHGVEYNVMSDTMNIDELISVAESITTKAIGK